MSAVAVIGRPTPTNLELVAAWNELGIPVTLVAPGAPIRLPVDTVLSRIDVLPSLDGMEPGMSLVTELAGAGVRILNRPGAVLRAHDKLMTARAFARSGIPHPRTVHVSTPRDHVPLELPLVVKPRFGSWGRDVVLCTSGVQLRETLRRLSLRSWFRSHGALVQELVPCDGHDLRIVVAAGEAVGAFERRAKPGEWRTNVSLGGVQLPAWPSPDARELAVEAVAAVGGDLMGVDLLPSDGGWVVLEVNGAVEFDDSTPLGEDVYGDAAEALELLSEPAALQVPA